MSKRSYLVFGLAALAIVCVASLLLYFWGGPKATVTGSTPEERAQSICNLADQPPRGAADAIVAAAGDADPTVRRVAVTALARFTRPQDRPVVEAALKDREPVVRAAAAQTLSRYADAPAEATLRGVLADDPSDKARIEAARALAAIASPSAIVALVEAMERNSSPDVRMAAFRALIQLENLGYINPPDPRNSAAWERLTRQVRLLKPVAAALKSTGQRGGTP